MVRYEWNLQESVLQAIVWIQTEVDPIPKQTSFKTKHTLEIRIKEKKRQEMSMRKCNAKEKKKEKNSGPLRTLKS